MSSLINLSYFISCFRANFVYRGSLGERLRLELNKQKSAMEIWKYEVHKATESQDRESLVDLYKGRLDLSIVSCRSEYGHVVVRAVNTNVAPGECLLLKPKSAGSKKQIIIILSRRGIEPWTPGVQQLTWVTRVRISAELRVGTFPLCVLEVRGPLIPREQNWVATWMGNDQRM